MKIVRFSDCSTIKYGILENNVIKGLKTSPFSENWNKEVPDLDGSSYSIDDVTLLAPCEVTKYIGVGINYEESAKTLGFPVPERPILFLKPTNTIIGTGEKIVFPDGEGVTLIFEGELCVVIGKRAKNVKSEDALDYVLGYTCANDVTDVSKMKLDNGNPTRMKAGDTFGPIGPCISTDVDPENASIRTCLNGTLVQEGNSKDLIFNVRYLISYISNFMTLLPGDVIATGTPPGNRPVNAGDNVKVEIEGIGVLENMYVSLSL